jgi:glucokinase
LTSEIIYQAATRDDKIALEAFQITGEILGIKLADAVAHTAPEKIFLFGGLAKSGDYILKPTRESFNNNLLKIWQGKIPIELSQLAEGNVAILGASALIWQELNKQ